MNGILEVFMAGYLADSLFISSRFISSFYVAFNSKNGGMFGGFFGGSITATRQPWRMRPFCRFSYRGWQSDFG
jgi:hypothetical protein